MSQLLSMEIDLNIIKENINAIQKLSNKKLIPVIKSNAYNLGDYKLMELVSEMKLTYGAVVDMDEALRLLNYNPNYSILILNSLLQQEYGYLNKYPNLAISINKIEDAISLSRIELFHTINVHLQIDTGMNRLGFTSILDFRKALAILLTIKNVNVEGLYTHFSSLNNSDKQLVKFEEYSSLYPFKIVHLAASSTYEHIDFGNYIRVGLNVYGVNKFTQSIKVSCYPLEINNIKKGESVGYEETYVALTDMRVAVLPIGYANGFRRSLSGYKLLLNGKFYKTIGLVCMNHLFVEVDDSVNMNSEFIITSIDHPVEDMAKYLNTTPHEILCMLNIDNKIYKG